MDFAVLFRINLVLGGLIKRAIYRFPPLLFRVYLKHVFVRNVFVLCERLHVSQEKHVFDIYILFLHTVR